MKQSLGFTKLVPSLVTLVAMIVSFWLLSPSGVSTAPER